MTYSIIPPIILVLSLIGIILFLMKKIPAVKNIREDVAIKPKAEIAPANNGVKMQVVRHRFFLVLEKMTRKFKVMFLKLENKFTNWNESIREKRKNHANNRAEAGIEEGIKNVSVENRPFSREALEDRINRPMISDKVVMPQAKQPEVKDRLEKLLIERIAVNPKDTEAYERLGEYYFEIRNYNYAKECFKQVIKLNPANQDAKNRMKKLERILMR